MCQNKRISEYILALVLACLCAGLTPARAQNVSDLIISEVLASPDSLSIVDDYGARNGWIEIFNNSNGTVNLGGCFLTDDPRDLRKSLIPKGDNRTKLGPRQVVLFYASGNGDQGTFYTGFKTREGSTVYLVSNDGKTIIDSLAVPSDLSPGKSAGKLAFDNKQVGFVPVGELQAPSPRIVNTSGPTESKSEKIAKTDPHGWILALVSVSVVFFALLILWILFASLFQSKAGKPEGKREKPAKAKKAGKDGAGMTPEVAAAIALALENESSGPVYAAIATALHLHLSSSVHDAEPFVITIRQGAGSNWTAKGGNFRRTAGKK